MKMTYAAQTLLTTYSGRRNVSQSYDIIDEYLFELRCLILYWATMAILEHLQQWSYFF